MLPDNDDFSNPEQLQDEEPSEEPSEEFVPSKKPKKKKAEEKKNQEPEANPADLSIEPVRSSGVTFQSSGIELNQTW